MNRSYHECRISFRRSWFLAMKWFIPRRWRPAAVLPRKRFTCPSSMFSNAMIRFAGKKWEGGWLVVALLCVLLNRAMVMFWHCTILVPVMNCGLLLAILLLFWIPICTSFPFKFFPWDFYLFVFYSNCFWIALRRVWKYSMWRSENDSNEWAWNPFSPFCECLDEDDDFIRK